MAALGLAEPGLGRLERYLDTLAAWSARVNLTGARDVRARVRMLVEDVLPALALPAPGRLLDLGSGNGSPGLVFALLRDDLEVTLLEPRAHRWAFLREAARAAGGPRVTVVRARHDAYVGVPAQTVTLRALALPLGELGPLLVAGGRVIVFGSAPALEPPFAAVPGAAGGRQDVHVLERGGNVPRGT